MRYNGAEREATGMLESALPLPDDCAVRLIDLEPGVDGLIAVDEDGFVNIYINARLSRDGQLRALRHELRHFHRDDLYSDRDIREVERLADKPVVLAMDGTPLEDPAPAFDPEALKPLGRGLYRPLGANIDRAAGDLERIRALLTEAGRICDVMRGGPGVALMALAEGLNVSDIAFIAWQPAGAAFPVSLRFYREEANILHGALFYDARGRLDNALAAFETENRRVAIDLRQWNGRLDVRSIELEADGHTEHIYG